MPQLVTVGTDGATDWVQLADGQKLMLGPISVLKFVTELGTGGANAARSTLDQFLKDGQSMLTVDPDKMWALLKPHRARWTSVQPLAAVDVDLLIPPEDRTPPLTRQGKDMADDADKYTKEAISNQIARIEGQIQLLQGHAKEAAPGSIGGDLMRNEIERLREMVAFLRRPSSYGNQSDNSTYYGLPEKLPSGESARRKEAAVQQNSQMARRVLGTLGQAEERIDSLVLAGKKFDVAKAKMDLFKVAKNVDIVIKHQKFADAGPEVAHALTELGKKADQLLGLFPTKA